MNVGSVWTMTLIFVATVHFFCLSCDDDVLSVRLRWGKAHVLVRITWSSMVPSIKVRSATVTPLPPPPKLGPTHVNDLFCRIINKLHTRLNLYLNLKVTASILFWLFYCGLSDHVYCSEFPMWSNNSSYKPLWKYMDIKARHMQAGLHVFLNIILISVGPLAGVLWAIMWPWATNWIRLPESNFRSLWMQL